MTSTWSTSGRISSSTAAGVAGLMTTPAPLPSRLDALHGAVQVGVALPVHQERIGTRLAEFVQEQVRVGNHHVSLQRQSCHPPQRLDDDRAKRDVRHKMAVHHIHMDAVGPALLGLVTCSPSGRSRPQGLKEQF